MKVTVEMDGFALVFDGVGRADGGYSDVLFDRKDGTPAFSVMGKVSDDAQAKCLNAASLMKQLSEKLLEDKIESVMGGLT